MSTFCMAIVEMFHRRPLSPVKASLTFKLSVSAGSLGDACTCRLEHFWYHLVRLFKVDLKLTTLAFNFRTGSVQQTS